LLVPKILKNPNTSKKKIKKHEDILLELKRRRNMNDKYCYFNSITPSSYMEGSNKIIKEMIEFIENLK